MRGGGQYRGEVGSGVPVMLPGLPVVGVLKGTEAGA